MFSNYFLIDKNFLERFNTDEQDKLADFAYSVYLSCLKKKSKKLDKATYLASSRVHYSLAYTYCPKCKSKGFIINHLTRNQSNSFKFCPHCGEPNIIHRLNVGREKVVSLLTLSKYLEENVDDVSLKLNQQILVSICSIYEVYLREFYADLLNTKFIRADLSLYDKFVSDCKNDFLNPGKTHSRLKKELDIDYKNTVGLDIFKVLSLWADYRNVIVHNNGICDKVFVAHHPEIEVRSELAPKWYQVVGYLHAVDLAVKKLDEIYSSVLLDSVIYELKLQLKSGTIKLKNE